MKENSTYCFKTPNFEIENGIIRGTRSPYVTEHNSFGEYLLAQLKALPEFVAQIDGLTGRQVRRGEMLEKSVKCAMWLKERNVVQGDVIGVCTHNQVDMYAPFYASLYLGAVFNPWWDTDIGKVTAQHFLKLTEPKVVFADEASARLIRDVAKEANTPVEIVVFGNLEGFQSLDDIIASQSGKNVADFQCTKLSSHEVPGVILYTSGSTGLPKGVVHSHASLFGNVKQYDEADKHEGTRVTLFYAPVAWITGAMVVLRMAVVPETRINYPKFSEEATFRLIEKYKVTWMLVAVSAAIRLIKSGFASKYNLSSLKTCGVGGSAVKVETLEGLASVFRHSDILHSYGSTELGSFACHQRPGRSKIGSCGSILPNVTIKIVDVESGATLGPNETGEIYMTCTYLMTGYYKNPEETAEVLDAEGWLHTGDLAYYDEEGDIFITDRIKEMIKFRCHHVSPGMIEQALQTHPGVMEAAAVGKPHPEDDELPTAFVALLPGADVTKEELLNIVANRVPDYMKLRGGIEFMKTLPHTPSGKIAKSVLKKQVMAL